MGTIKEKIKRARGGLTQAAFAEQLGISQALVSAWEGGEEPSSDGYLRLALLAPTGDNKWFAQQSGIAFDLLAGFAERVVGERIAKPTGLITIPPFGADQGELSNEKPIKLSAELVPHPLSTFYVRAKKPHADSPVATFLDEGDVVVFDRTVTDWHAFWGKIVVIESTGEGHHPAIKWPGKGIWVARLTANYVTFESDGIKGPTGRYHWDAHLHIAGFDDHPIGTWIGRWTQEGHVKPEPGADPKVNSGLRLLGGRIALLKAESQ